MNREEITIDRPRGNRISACKLILQNEPSQY